MAKSRIQIAHSPDSKEIGLITDDGRAVYAFPAGDIPTIVDALRAAAAGEWTPRHDNRVFPIDARRVGLRGMSPEPEKSDQFSNANGKGGSITERALRGPEIALSDQMISLIDEWRIGNEEV